MRLPDGRQALLRAPAALAPRPAVIMLHGYTATPEGEEEVSGWTSFFTGTDVVVAYPEGTPTPSGGDGWDTGTARYSVSGFDDVAVIGEVIDELVAHDCVAPTEVLITGESNGGALTLLLACDPRTAHRAVLFAPVIPAVDPHVTARCARATPVPLLVLASLGDRTVPYDGSAPPGEVPLSAPLAWFRQLAPTMEGCTGVESSRPVQDAAHISFAPCSAPADFFAVTDGVHTWPGGPRGAGGLPPGKFPASALVWCASGLPGGPASLNCASVRAAYGLGD